MSEPQAKTEFTAQDMTLRCKVLAEIFSDEELGRFLSMSEQKIAIAIYQALLSASTVAESSRSSGGVSESYAVNWEKLLATWKSSAAAEGYSDPGNRVWVLQRG